MPLSHFLVPRVAAVASRARARCESSAPVCWRGGRRRRGRGGASEKEAVQRLLQDSSNFDMGTQVTTPPVCGTQQFTHLATVASHSATHVGAVCQHCGVPLARRSVTAQSVCPTLFRDAVRTRTSWTLCRRHGELRSACRQRRVCPPPSGRTRRSERTECTFFHSVGA